jgi:signal transduction histidine kinase
MPYHMASTRPHVLKNITYTSPVSQALLMEKQDPDNIDTRATALRSEDDNGDQVSKDPGGADATATRQNDLVTSGWAQLLRRTLELSDAPGASSNALREIIKEAGALLSASGASVYLFSATRELKHEASFGLSDTLLRQIEETAQTGAVKRLLVAGNSPSIIEDVKAPSNGATGVSIFLEALVKEGVVSTAAFPLVARDDLLGFLAFYHQTRRAYLEEETGNLSLLAGVLALALLNNRLAEARQVEDTGRDHFISALSHELRTPLTSIIGFTQIIRRKLSTSPTPIADGRMAEHMDVIWAQAQRLNRLIDTFVDIANIEQGDFTIKFGRVELVSILKSSIEQTVARVNPSCEAEIKVPDHPVWVRGDKQRLEQVFGHVISNALRYSPPDYPVIIECIEHASEGQIEVSVTDRGPGISESLREAVFERFYQVEALRSGGLGVGLYLSKTIVEAHGGQITVQSGPSEGTTVSMMLPL